jgi:Bacterial Ig domain
VLNIPAPGILANDTYAAGTTIIAAKVTNPSDGTLTLSANGSFSYTPNTGYVGTDTFTYKANDGTTDSNIATISITVTEKPASAGGGGGGAGTGQGGGALIIQNQPGITNVSSMIDANGMFIQGITALSDDDQTIVTIESGTNVKTADGKPFTQISIIPTDDLPNPPKGVDIISPMYDFGPSGATFNPAATINLQYDPKNVPTDVSESNFVIGYYDNKTADWITLASTVDTITHNVTAQTGHFSLFAVLSGPTANPSISSTSPSTTIVVNIPSSSPVVPANTPSTITANLQPTPIITTPSLPAALVLSDINISPEEIFVGKSIKVNTIVTNPGKVADIYRVVISIDNVEISAKDIYLDSGTSETVSFNVVQNTAGRHILAINGTQQVFEVKAIPVVVAPPWPIWIWIVLGAFAFAVSLLTTVLMGRRRRNSA